MSLKASAFALAFSCPKTIDKFYVQLPGSSKSLFRVSATSLPYSNRSEGAIWLFGRPVYIPTAKLVDGEWSCVVEEDAALSSSAMISALERRIGTGNSFRVDKINIFVTDQFTGVIPQLAVTLKYAWLKKVEPVSLDWSKPDQKYSYRLTFKYSSLKRWY